MNKKNFVITGISSGFGLLLTEALLKEGHFVVGIARGGSTRLLKTPLEVFLPNKNQFLVIDLDLKNTGEFSSAASKALAFLENRVDVLINNAGMGYLRPLFAQTNEEIQEQIQINFLNLLFWTRLFMESLKKSQGRILQISSIAGLTSFPFYGAYAASKHALEAASEALYYELYPLGIQVSLIEPGGFQTSFTKKAIHTTTTMPNEFSNALEKLTHFFNNQKSKWTKSPEPVIKLLVKLSFQKKIPLRTRVGIDAHLLYFIKIFFPEFLRIKIIQFLYRRYF